MTSKDIEPKKHSATKVIYRFLGGAALGAFAIFIPISYGSSIDLNLVQIGMVSLVVMSCGLLSSLWGEKFIDAMTSLLNSFGS
ncbi:MAG TPA: hypothetical protein VK211_05325 [Kamptonema sp.]|nr:hypothetical protein [Kamptonema sp.]